MTRRTPRALETNLAVAGAVVLYALIAPLAAHIPLHSIEALEACGIPSE